MSTRTSTLGIAFAVAVAVAMTGCAASESPTPSESPTEVAAVPEPAPSLTPNPREPDATLFISVLATAENGARLSIEGMVHRSLSHEYPGSQTINTNVINDCGATLTNAIFAAEGWSFTRMQVTAIPPEDSAVEWPAEARVGYRPSTENVYMSARGMIQSDAATGDLACVQEKFSIGAGRGAFFAGIPDDTLTLDTFNNRWAQHTWGFTAGDGVTFSDCSFEVTPLGDEFGAAAAGWVEFSDDRSCYVGPASEPSVF